MSRPLILALLLSSSAFAINSTIRDNNKSFRLDCNEANDVVTVRGNKNTVVLTGTCESVTVDGNNNTLQAATIRTLSMRGNNNRVTVKQGSTNFSNTGKNNQFVRPAPTTAPATPPNVATPL
ncbi:DUF3060 domain-containing protein [Deinococcus yavapaiensis]|uniref:DUF3060 family protein n=1 Tax=Deinococcus yavapaiensis KR-236 TaxID=694435 RepID=A0A318SAQ0_9DEIO|nr:DUF3060 domain-containing protein [Deinococcus yavapaiensis]PYE55290.1 hypothetical protein DES52_103121 [Deinococcus yavapaiensis KR-236]